VVNWRKYFEENFNLRLRIFSAGTYLFGATAFWLWAKADIQPWAKPKESPNDNDEIKRA
jgi:hypothetical protein